MDISRYKNLSGVYILQSQKNYRFYIGCTADIEARLGYHNAGKVKATQNLIPWELKFFQPCSNITKAKKLEYGLKKLKRRDYIQSIITDQKIIGALAQWL